MIALATYLCIFTKTKTVLLKIKITSAAIATEEGSQQEVVHQYTSQYAQPKDTSGVECKNVHYVYPQQTNTQVDKNLARFSGPECPAEIVQMSLAYNNNQ